MLAGLVLAAGAGTRFGGPKGLVRDEDGVSWVERAVRMLRAGGCERVLVAVAACGDEVAALVPPEAEVVRVGDWASGLAATLRTGLAAASRDDVDAVVITPVDTPDAAPEAVRRVVAAIGSDLAQGLARAVYRGAPGHPVVIGAAHLADVADAIHGDRGAGGYLRAHGAVEVECADLWSGADVDHRPRLDR